MIQVNTVGSSQSSGGGMLKKVFFLRRCQKMIGSAFTIRNASDYDDMFIASKQETAIQIQNARFVYDSVERYLASRLNESMS